MLPFRIQGELYNWLKRDYIQAQQSAPTAIQGNGLEETTSVNINEACARRSQARILQYTYTFFMNSFTGGL